MVRWLTCLPSLLALGFCLVPLGSHAAPRPLESGTAAISTNSLLARTATLASDYFEGRGPGTRGEERTTSWLIDQFRALGLKPGGTNGSWVQEVPMVGVKSETRLSLKQNGQSESLVFPQDFVSWSPIQRESVSVQDAELVFVGYGVVAPEYNWDDFKGVDVRGKIVVMLINDPPVPDPKDPSRLDDAMFRGKAMTYYGRWTYKYEIAAARGATGALIIHETQPAAYPWFVVVNSWGRERFDLEGPTGPQLQMAGWLSLERAQKLLTSVGSSYEQAKRQALQRDFKPIPLGIRADVVVTNTLRHIRSKNVLARLDGSDRRLRDEWVVVTAHWDHLGIDPTRSGDTIFNGAADNAIGTAGLLELATGFARLPKPPRRSLLFAAVTGEEQGLLGAAYYAAHPLHPLDHTVAAINMDGLNTWGVTRDIAIVGFGNSTLDDHVQAVATRQGRTVRAEPNPEKGIFYRSDHFEFAKAGVPALYLKPGVEYVGKPADYGTRKSDEFTERDYHKVSDEVKPDWDLSGAVEDLRLLLEVTDRVSNESKWPEWRPGTEFKARRDDMLKLLR
jgi:Zn-dependent M28 family amino/carboxypeptidase